LLVLTDVFLPFKASIADINGCITSLQNSLSTLLLQFPRSHSNRITILQDLAGARYIRYTLLEQKGDLDMSILHCNEAISLLSMCKAGHSKSVVRTHFLLANLLLRRSEEFGQPEDLEGSITHLRYLRGLPLESFNISSNDVTASIIRALGFQVELEAGDGEKDIEEMVVLCHELITSNDFPASSFMSLSEAANAEVTRGRPIKSLDKVIECLQDAAKVCPPSSHSILYALATVLGTRFHESYSHDDYEGAMMLLERIVDRNHPGECADSIRSLASSHAAFLADLRSHIFENPEYSEVAISHLRAELSSSSLDERVRVRVPGSLAVYAINRFTNYGLADSIQEANAHISEAVRLLSSQSRSQSIQRAGEFFCESNVIRESYSTTAIQKTIQNLEELLSNTPPGTSNHKGCLRRLAAWYQTKFNHTGDISDIEKSISYIRLFLNTTLSSSQWRIISLNSLHYNLLLAFRHTNEINYLNESIIVGYDILKSKIAPHSHFLTIQRLGPSLFLRWRLLGQTEDIHEAIRVISLAVVDSQFSGSPDRFRLACKWAALSRLIGHPSIPTAYSNAMSLLQKSLSFAPNLSTQHRRLSRMGEEGQRLPLEYASYQIDLGCLEGAIETLEQGRTLLWSEMRGLRTPMTHLAQDDSPLAKKFFEINQELEALTMSDTPGGRPKVGDGIAHREEWADPFGRLVIKQRQLVEERDALISRIQGQPGLRVEEFSRAPSFATLRSAALRGPVILINHCFWRCDILIIIHDSLPCSIPTSDDFYDRAHKLRDELRDARKQGLNSREYKDVLCSVLEGLYELVGKPVIERLRVLGVPEQSRIWLCPTSVFCSLPLHAMGPIPSSETGKPRYFSDLYIPSYTPSLSALIESRRKATPQMLDRPSLLLVAQPEDSLPGVNGEIKVIRALKSRVTVTGLVSSDATPSSVLEWLRSSHFAHFACHGVLEEGKPFEASFKLHGGSRLTLLDIVRSRLPDAEIAFLSCCHTAETTERSVADEALHLVAAMQYCGFRSVVGTMWEMADMDGRDLAKNFYKSLFSCEGGVPYYEQSAEALRDATQKLRQKRGVTLERWVNFVHYGA
jgi:CHAT domain-containing protein